MNNEENRMDLPVDDRLPEEPAERIPDPEEFRLPIELPEEESDGEEAEAAAEEETSVPDMADLEIGAREASVVEVDGRRVQVDDLLADFREGEDEAPDLLPEEESAEAEQEAAPPEEVLQARARAAVAQRKKPAVRLDADEYLIDTAVSSGMDGETPRKNRKRRAHFAYYIGEALHGIGSHGFMSFATVCIITACLLIMGAFSMVALNLNSALSELMERNEFLAYVDENYTRDEAEALQSQIESIENVSEVTFITKEEAKETYISDQGDSELYDDLPDTIFRDRYAIHVEDLSKIEDTIAEVKGIEGIAKISAELDVANGFVTIRNIAMLVAGVLVVILVVVSLFIISNTIKLATVSRGDEIAVMRMCGATNSFIRWPFVYEGAIFGLIGALIAYGIMSALYQFIIQGVAARGGLSMLDLIPYSQLYLYVLGIFVAAGLLIGVFGSATAIRRYLKI